MRITLTERPAFLEFEHWGSFGSAERLERLYIGAGAAAHETSCKPILLNFLQASFTENDHGKRIDFFASAITHPFFIGRRTALLGISREDASTTLLAAYIRGEEIDVFERRDDAIYWLTHP